MRPDRCARICPAAAPAAPHRPYLPNSQSRLSSGHTCRVFSQREMPARRQGRGGRVSTRSAARARGGGGGTHSGSERRGCRRPCARSGEGARSAREREIGVSCEASGQARRRGEWSCARARARAPDRRDAARHAPRHDAVLGGRRRLVGLALDAEVHDVVAADGAVLHDDVPAPERDGRPLLDLRGGPSGRGGAGARAPRRERSDGAKCRSRPGQREGGHVGRAGRRSAGWSTTAATNGGPRPSTQTPRTSKRCGAAAPAPLPPASAIVLRAGAVTAGGTRSESYQGRATSGARPQPRCSCCPFK